MHAHAHVLTLLHTGPAAVPLVAQVSPEHNVPMKFSHFVYFHCDSFH